MKIYQLNMMAFVVLGMMFVPTLPSQAMNLLQDEEVGAAPLSVDLSQAQWQEASLVNPEKTRVDDFMDNLNTTRLFLKNEGVAPFFVKYARQFQRIEELFLEHVAMMQDAREIIQLITSDREQFFPKLHIYVRSQVDPNVPIPDMFLSMYVPNLLIPPIPPLMTDADVAGLAADYDDHLNLAVAIPGA